MKIYWFLCCKMSQFGVKGQQWPREPKLHPSPILYTPTPNKLEAHPHTLPPPPSLLVCPCTWPLCWGLSSILSFSSSVLPIHGGWGQRAWSAWRRLHCLPSVSTGAYLHPLLPCSASLWTRLTPKMVLRDRWKEFQNREREKKKKRKLTTSPPSWWGESTVLIRRKRRREGLEEQEEEKKRRRNKRRCWFSTAVWIFISLPLHSLHRFLLLPTL